MSRTDYRSRPNSRPESASDQNADLHVYVVPSDIWRDRYNNLLNQSVTETISVGIIRVNPQLYLFEVREQLERQLEEQCPREYVFLRSVGRSLTRLKGKQEHSMKVKHFLPPVAYAPELFLLEASPDTRTSMGSDAESQVSFRNLGDSPRYNNFRDDYRDPGSKTYRSDYRDRDRERDRSRERYNEKYNNSKKEYRRSPERQPVSHRENENHRSPERELQSKSEKEYRRSPERAPPPPRGKFGKKTGPGDLQNENSSRNQRAGDRKSPIRRYTPIPKLDPSSPTASRNASPERTDGSDRKYYRSSSPERRNDDTRREDSRDNDRDNRYDGGNDDRYDRSDSPKRNEDDAQYSYNNRYADQDRKSVQRNFEDRYDRQSPDRSRAYERNAGNETYRRNSPEPDRDVNGYQVLPPINDTPPRSAERSPRKQGDKDTRSATYTTNTNTDSGIADSGVSPEDQYHRGSRRDNYEEENARKRRELRDRLDNDKFDMYDDNTYNLDDIEDRDQIDRERWENDRNYRRQWIEEERKRREEEEARKKRQEAGEDDDDDRKMKRSESEEELARYPSPPELDIGSPRETESARRRNEEEKERLLQELENAREGRKSTEREREELVKKAKQLQNRTQNRRNHARDIWKKRYFEEKKKTAPLEEQTNRLRHELENIHRKLMSTLEGPKEKNIKLGDVKPSPKNNYIIQCTRLQHEIEDLRRRVENAKMKLTAEMKLRNQAEAELRALRAELTQKKINLTLTRNQQLAALNPAGDVPLNQQQPLVSQS